MKKVIITSLIGFLCLSATFSQSVRIDSLYSNILKRTIPVTIILPPSYDAAKQYTVFYLLHGWKENHDRFLKTNLLSELKEKELIVVTPKADSSWYVNSFSDPNNKYEDFMTLELFDYVDKNYHTFPDQAIGGYSMGGFGALMIGLKHPERFKFMADISGTINPPFSDIPLGPGSLLNVVINSVRQSFGDANSNVSTGSNVFSLARSTTISKNIFIYMAVGRQDQFDFMIPQHGIFIKILDERKIKYQYQEFDADHFDGKVMARCFPVLLNKLTDTLK